MSAEKTLPSLLIEKATSSGNSVALRQKSYGIWNEITWNEYLENVKSLSLGLYSELGFKKDDKLAIIGDNRPHWLYSKLAAQALGGIAVGIYQESFGEQLIYYINHSDARFVIAEDQEQVDKLLEIEEMIPRVEKIIYYNDKGMRRYKSEKLLYIGDLQKAGEIYGEKNPTFFKEKVEQVLGSDIAVISYTSGSTGNPKGVMLSHANLISALSNLDEVDKLDSKDDYISFLPLAWISEQVMSIVGSLYKGMVINFPEQPTTVINDLREIGPHTLIAPPRTYENIISRFRLRIGGAGWLKSKVYNFFKPYGEKMAKAKLNKQTVSFGTRFMYTLGDFLLFSAIRDHLGLARIKRAYTNGGMLSEEAISFFHSIGVNLKQCYGATEVGGIVFAHRDSDITVNSVGVPLPNVDIKISEDDEIFIKSPSGFVGYYKEEAQSNSNEWIALGDSGKLDGDGHLYISDQVGSIITTLSGEKIAPVQIENKLKGSQYIKEAIVFGRNKPYLVSMINIDMSNVGRWAEKNQIVYTTFADLSMKEEVTNLIEKEVASIMKELPDSMRVKKIVILHKELDADHNELTRLQKIRRGYLEEKYSNLLEGLYLSNDNIPFGDEEETSLKVIDLEGNKEVA